MVVLITPFGEASLDELGDGKAFRLGPTHEGALVFRSESKFPVPGNLHGVAAALQVFASGLSAWAFEKETMEPIGSQALHALDLSARP